MSSGDRTLPSLVAQMLESYHGDPRGHRISRRLLPSREDVIACIQLLLQLFYPGYHGRQDLQDEMLAYHVGTLLTSLREKLTAQIHVAMCTCGESEPGGHVDVDACRDRAEEVTAAFLAQLPALRTLLLSDVQAAYDGDPAATSLDEIILAYPGLLAVTVHRVAHALHVLGVPLVPRIMSEWAHGESGADIHPGATVGPSFFIDHATGVVIGETAVLGEAAKLYQGVTLGALSIRKDARGRVIRGTKRHPTLGDNVTLYANATVLGGDTVVGSGSVVGGSVFLTATVPEGSRIAVKPPELRVQSGKAPPGTDSVHDAPPLDFEI